MAIAFGFVFGVVSGCGIGGGSILVPLLVLFMGVSQPQAQGVCLVAFLPSAISALIVHVKNKNVDFKAGRKYILPGLLFAVMGSFAVRFFDTTLLRRFFGGFLVCFSIYQGVSISRTMKEDKH